MDELHRKGLGRLATEICAHVAMRSMFSMNEKNKLRNQRLERLEGLGGSFGASDAIVKRLEALEARPSAKWAGIWSGLESYKEMEFVSHQGCLWCCTASNTSQRPNTSPGYWKLIVKKGDHVDPVARSGA